MTFLAHAPDLLSQDFLNGQEVKTLKNWKHTWIRLSTHIRSSKKCMLLIILHENSQVRKKRFKFLMQIFLSIWFWIEVKICEDLLLFNKLWQNYQGQGSQVCGHVVSNWRNHGTPHWVLHHQWSRDYVLCNQNNPQNNQR